MQLACRLVNKPANLDCRVTAVKSHGDSPLVGVPGPACITAESRKRVAAMKPRAVVRGALPGALPVDVGEHGRERGDNRLTRRT